MIARAQRRIPAPIISALRAVIAHAALGEIVSFPPIAPTSYIYFAPTQEF
jgi:hypothetical protein